MLTQGPRRTACGHTELLTVARINHDHGTGPEVTLYALDGTVWDVRVARSFRGAMRMVDNHSRRLATWRTNPYDATGGNAR